MAEARHTNRLALETSPYLLQHAHNPVDWYPWGEEAFERARAEDKPIFLSVGYSACHWCHVMEQESFESESIAQIMNAHCVNIKVDREERPEVDAIYMNFVQATTGSGGWPMSVFLTPDGIPFYGGTYFPTDDAYGRTGFRRVLESIAYYYRNRREDLLKNSPAIIQTLHKMTEVPEAGRPLDETLLDNAHDHLRRRFDPIHGGFGQAPKFPSSMNIMFLLRYHLRHADSQALSMAEHSLRKMAEGGIYDQLGGGFHRYSVDNYWLVPHFEKMLYDNALLARNYLEIYQLTQEPWYRRILEETLAYVRREMVSPEGGFYSAQDADSEGEEGKFFVWRSDEIEAILGKEASRVFCDYYGVTGSGNFEGHNILHVSKELAEVARKFARSQEEVEEILARSRWTLWTEREKRVHPATDTKVLTSWNGLMLAAFAEAYNVLGDPVYLETAEKNASFLLAQLRSEGRLLHTWCAGRARLNGYLDDYSHLVEGLIALYQATFDANWLDQARALADTLIEEFWDEGDKGFFFTGRSHEKLLVRHKEYYDNATPSGNSTATLALFKLARLTGEHRYQRYAEETLQRIGAGIEQAPIVFGYQLCALDWRLATVREFIVIAQGSEKEGCQRALYSKFIPNKVVAGKAPGAPSSLPLMEGRDSMDQKPTLFICENFTCKSPVTGYPEVLAELEALKP